MISDRNLIVGDKNMQKRYWNYMTNIRFRIFYLDLYADNVYKRDMGIKVFSAIASSASIAAWAIWQELAFFWSMIIAVFQVMNAVKGYLPYSTILKNIGSAQKNLKLLYNKIEYNWFWVESGEFPEEKLNELLHDFEKEYIEIESQCFEGGTPWAENEKLHKKAEQKMKVYFENNFNSKNLLE